jgi:hypothetical protein
MAYRSNHNIRVFGFSMEPLALSGIACVFQTFEPKDMKLLSPITIPLGA